MVGQIADTTIAQIICKIDGGRLNRFTTGARLMGTSERPLQRTSRGYCWFFRLAESS